MKIEFLDDISDGGRFPDIDPNQLVRLFDFDSSQAKELKQSIQGKIIERNNEIELATLDFVESINCNLTLKIGDTDKSILKLDTNRFVYILTVEKYEEMIF